MSGTVLDMKYLSNMTPKLLPIVVIVIVFLQVIIDSIAIQVLINQYQLQKDEQSFQQYQIQIDGNIPHNLQP